MKSGINLNERLLLATAKKFSVITHPVRIQILKLLDENEKLNVTQIYQKISMPQAETSNHLANLRRSSILKKVRLGKMSIYSLNRELIEDTIKIAEELTKK